MPNKMSNHHLPPAYVCRERLPTRGYVSVSQGDEREVAHQHLCQECVHALTGLVAGGDQHLGLAHTGEVGCRTTQGPGVYGCCQGASRARAAESAKENTQHHSSRA